MSTTYSIKKITEKDIEQFYPFFKKSVVSQFPEYTKITHQYFIEHDYSLEKCISVLKDKTKYIYVAYGNSQPVGYLFANIVYGGIGFCEWLAVCETQKKKGIGSALLRAYEKEALENGAHKVHLWSLEINIPFYNKNGYILAGKIPQNYFGTDDCLMYKELRAAEEKNYLKNFLK